MASEILMPRLGWTMEEGIFGEWLKQDGDAVKAGDLLFSVETDKATQEVESFENGILRIPPNAPGLGEVVPVGGLMGYVVAPGELAPFEQTASLQPPTLMPGATPTAPRATAVHEHSGATGRGSLSAQGRAPAISPRARRVAHELGVDWLYLPGSGRTGRIVERDVRTAAEALAVQRAEPPVAPAPQRVTPVAQRVARDAGIDLTELSPEAHGGRIQRKDVEAAIRAQQPALTDVRYSDVGADERGVDSALPAEASRADVAVGETVPTSRVRQIIAQRMMESVQGTAPVTLTTEADATDLVALREHLRAVLEARNRPAPTYNDLLIKLTALALLQHPMLNATWQGDTIQVWNAVHIGLAVDTEQGLVVPVVRDAHSRSVGQIINMTRDLITRAQSRRLQLHELEGATFTLTNLGMYGVDAFTPIINLPQCAILGVGRIQARPAVVNDQIVPRKLVTLSLTFDHRVVDGGPAARFLNTVREYVEEPALWMMERGDNIMTDDAFSVIDLGDGKFLLSRDPFEVDVLLDSIRDDLEKSGETLECMLMRLRDKREAGSANGGAL